eukprot:7370648-Pyramimonas_sp.AAC.1
MDFKRFGGSEAAGMVVHTKSKFFLLLAAVEFRSPRMKERMCRVRAALKDWDYAHQPRHTAPMISNVCACMCIHCYASFGAGRPRDPLRIHQGNGKVEGRLLATHLYRCGSSVTS